MSFKIGNIKIDTKVSLAPMAGVSNPSYIKLCEDMGLKYAITELLSAEAIVRNNKKTFDMLKGIEKIKIPVAVQLFGSTPETIAKAAVKLLELYDIKIIDLNFGCPVPKVAVRAESGSGLLKNPKKIGQIVKAVVEAVDVPVTAKIRSGWDSEHINAVEVAKICEESGASAITVHARTRSQGYTGKADWNIIKEVKENVGIPVIGNGDVKDGESAKKMLLETGCDAVMIGRASLGNPWIFKDVTDYLDKGIINKKKTPLERIETCIKHLKYLSENEPTKVAVLEIRNHVAWYLKGLQGGAEIKNKIYSTKNIEEINKILYDYKESIEEE